MLSSTEREAARRTAVYVHNMRRAGHGWPRRRMPGTQWPLALERLYGGQLAALIGEIRARADQALGELPQLLESARRDRADALELVREVIGLRVVIENAAGSIRQWTDADGTIGETVMRWDYGFLDGYEGADGEEVDVYIGPIPKPLLVYVVHQRRKGAANAAEWPTYDEDKVMLGWDSADDAHAAYLAQYNDPRFFGGMSSFTVDDFKRRLRESPGRKLTHADREVRADAGEGRRSRQLLDRVRDGVRGSGARVESIAGNVAKQVAAKQRDQLGRQAQAALGVDITPLLADPKMAAMIDGFIHENVALINGLGSKSIDDIEKLVTRGLVDGQRADELGAAIAERWAMSERHARLIARDQIGKLNGQITRARHAELGIARFRWLTMRDDRVRPTHREMEGKVFAYKGPGAPPFFPGQEVCCRCGEEPVFDDVMAELDALLAGKPADLAPASGLAKPPPAKWAAPPRGPPAPRAPRQPRAPKPATPLVVVQPAIAGPPGQPIPPPAPVVNLAVGAGGGGAAPPPKPPPGGGGSSSGGSPKRWRRANPAGLREQAQRSIISLKPLGGGVNQTYVATLDDGSRSVWKPVAGERAGLRSNIKVGTSYKREAAAAAVAQQLGVSDLMPATVVHQHGNARGSLQAFADGSKALGRNVAPFDRDTSERMRVFDFVVGNTDRHQGNVLQRDRKSTSVPVLIDHGLCFPSGPPDRFIQPWDHIAKDRGPLLAGTLEQVKNIDPGRLAKTLLDSGLDEAAVTHTLYRAQLIKLRPELLEVPSGGNGARAWDRLGSTAHTLLPAAERQAMEAIVQAQKGKP